MDQLNLLSITGIVQRIESASEDCCQQIVTIRNQEGVTQMIVSPETYVIDMVRLLSITGIVQRIESASEDCCQQIVTIRNQEGVTQMIVSPETYVIDMVRLRIGMRVTAFYDANAPAPLIMPPQYQALIIGRSNANETVYVGFFDETL